MSAKGQSESGRGRGGGESFRVDLKRLCGDLVASNDALASGVRGLLREQELVELTVTQDRPSLRVTFSGGSTVEFPRSSGLRVSGPVGLPLWLLARVPDDLTVAAFTYGDVFVAGAGGELWDGDGLTRFTVAVSHGSSLACAGAARFAGDVAELV
jgi:hypothetical protein